MELKYKQRKSNLELYRILVMLFIVAHHYVLKSGITDYMIENPFAFNSVCLNLIGMWGKTGINCFVLITGYFMCTSEITIKKFIKLLLEIEFYYITINTIFLISGYEKLTLSNIIYGYFPIKTLSYNFVGSYMIFYLFIPFLNILIRNLNKKQHLLLILLCILIYSGIGTLPKIINSPNYITWFCILYTVSSYIRIWGFQYKISNRQWGIFTLIFIIFSMVSVIIIIYLSNKLNYQISSYYFVSDSNKILAIATSFCSFMFFKEVKIKQNKWINTIAASTFGVLLIHDHSDAMRYFLWNVVYQNSYIINTYPHLILLHACLCIISLYTICIVIDKIRIEFIEKPTLKYLDPFIKHLSDSIKV